MGAFRTKHSESVSALNVASLMWCSILDTLLSLSRQKSFLCACLNFCWNCCMSSICHWTWQFNPSGRNLKHSSHVSCNYSIMQPAFQHSWWLVCYGLDVGREGVWRIGMQGHHLVRTLWRFYHNLYPPFVRRCCKKY